MNFRSYMKIFIAYSGQHILVLFVPYESKMNKAIFLNFSLNMIHAFYNHRALNILQDIPKIFWAMSPLMSIVSGIFKVLVKV